MKQLKLTVIAVAVSLMLSTGAMAQNMQKDDYKGGQGQDIG